MTQLDQGKFMFQRLSYEVSSQQILIKMNAKQGMPMKWDQIKRATKGKSGFTFYASKAQLIYLPFKSFNNDNEIRFIETVLKRKGYITEK